MNVNENKLLSKLRNEMKKLIKKKKLESKQKIMKEISENPNNSSVFFKNVKRLKTNKNDRNLPPINGTFTADKLEKQKCIMNTQIQNLEKMNIVMKQKNFMIC